MPARKPATSPASEHSLDDYPRPSVAVDTAVLTVPEGPDAQLSVLLVRRAGRHRRGQWLLPGTFVHPGETLADAALRALSTKAGIAGLNPRQLHVFDDPRRDDRGWVMSVAHVDVVPVDRLAAGLDAGSVLRPVDAVRGLAFDHDQIVRLAVEAVRSDYRRQPDPAGLLPEPFTLFELQRVHEAVLGHTVVKDTFRRHMEPMLQPTRGVRTGTVGKPARLWHR